MENEDKDDGYSEEEEEETCLNFVFRNHGELDESMISHVPGNSMTGERMTIRLLAECADSAFCAPRQSAARQILEALQLAVTSVEAYSEQDDVEKVFAYITKLSQDTETIVRCNLLSALPKVASFCAEYDSPLVSLKELIETDILPIVLKAIADEDKKCDMGVRKEGYSTLKYLLNENLVSKQSIENKICDLCGGLLFHPNNFVNVITAGNFIARMPPVVGEAATEKLLLPKISELCTNTHRRVREACVHFLIDLACFVNSLVTENIILPLFIKLSEDKCFWVRKACAETAVMLSCLCLMESRKTLLSRVFVNLLQDRVSSVASVAFKQLGAFITTFAQPSLTALGSNRTGDFLLIYCKGSTFELLSRHSLFQFYDQEQPEESPFCMFMLPMKADHSTNTVSTLEMNEVEDNDGEPTGGKEDDSYNNNSNRDLEDEQSCTNQPLTSCENPGAPNTTEDGFNATNDELTSTQFDNQPDLVQSCLQKTADKDVKSKCDRTTAENSAESPDYFNSFQFWRDPIPDFDEQDIYSSETKRTQSLLRKEMLSSMVNNMRPRINQVSFAKLCYDVLNEYDDVEGDNYWNESHDFSNYCGSNVANESFEFTSDHSVSEADYVSGRGRCAANRRLLRMRDIDDIPKSDDRLSLIMVKPKQSVLPQILLDAFISMAETVPVEIKINCAYTFPAVLLTLGAANWSLLKNVYSKLAVDSDRKLRLMIASSIHEIASILGPELATQDLIPIYNSLINDLEDIRITALNHLSGFVKLLKPHGRCMFLPHLMEFMMTDYTWNWRFRKQLSEQLIEMMDLFVPSDCWKYVSPVAFALLMDRVSAVRLQALNLVTSLIRIVSVDITLLRGILAELAEQFAHSTQWARRQSFAFLCSCLMKTPVLPDDMFARDVLPHLLDLSWDSIPNVRIAVARTLSCDVATYPYFSNIFSPHYEVLATVLKRLCKDKDRDVRYFASLNTSALPPLAAYEKSREKPE